ncbi:MAG TPA: RNHCP domain-containing protein [Candidatus Gracilibacteria bacterium]|nr:RNHCP domain-containing protein [Candidatus Gracilibacteria bacterium]
MININESFTCEHCGKENPKALQSCRNHCRFCLYSKHVDLAAPGDRQSDCHGLMVPTGVTQTGAKGFQIIHKCQKCGKEIANITAEDDNLDQIIKIMQIQNVNQPQPKRRHA